MKYWILYFLCGSIIFTGVFFVTDSLAEAPEIPTVSVCIKGEIVDMSVEEFALRVLLAEGGELKHPEAKKAFAVAARSCGLYLSLLGCKHDEFDVCDKGDCCFSIASPDNAGAEYLKECAVAIEETAGLCLCYDSLPAMALFSLCNGSGSRDCEEFGYITAVSEENICEIHKKESLLDYSVLESLAGCDKESLKENSVVVYKDNNKCEFAILGGKYIKGAEISAAIEVNSREFSLGFENEGVRIKSYGVGNGFGLSICGSEAKAESGWNFEEIIENYYPALALNKMYNN